MAREQVWQEHIWHGHPAPQKGALGGACNTYTCAHSGADWYSRSSGKYYCDECARQLNEACLAQGARKICELHF